MDNISEWAYSKIDISMRYLENVYIFKGIEMIIKLNSLKVLDYNYPGFLAESKCCTRMHAYPNDNELIWANRTLPIISI